METYLLADQLGHAWITMTEGIDGNTGCEIEVAAVFGIPEVASFSFDHQWWWADVCCYHKWCVLFKLGDGGGVGWRIGVRE